MFLPFKDDNPTQRPPICTLAIIAINAIVFMFGLGVPRDEQMQLAYSRGFVPARLGQIHDPRPIVVPIQNVVQTPFGPRVVQVGELIIPASRNPLDVVSTLLTCMFLHAGWIHLIGNMWFLWIFGNNVEDRLGHVGYCVLYLGGGVLASLAHWAFGPESVTPVIGASGAVATVLGAYLVTWPWARIRTLLMLVVFFTIIDVPAVVVLGGWFILQLLEGFKTINVGVGGGVAWWAHVGGFVVGAVAMPVLSYLTGFRPGPAPSDADAGLEPGPDPRDPNSWQG